MTTRRPNSLSSGSSPLPMDLIDLTEESPIYRPTQTSSISTARSRRSDKKLQKLALIAAVLGTPASTVTEATSVTPSTSQTRNGIKNTGRGAMRRVTKNNGEVRSTITASKKSRSGSNNQCRNEAKLDKTIILDDTILPEHSSPWCLNESSKLICSICLEEILSQRKPTTTRCGHIFCEECLDQAMSKQKKCPQCRTSITKKSCIRLHF